MRWIIFAATLALYELIRVPATAFDEHVRLAYSMLHGSLNVDTYPVWEKVVVNGHAFILHPPLGAIACLPFVAFGVYDQTLISMLYGALAVTLAYQCVYHHADGEQDYQVRHLVGGKDSVCYPAARESVGYVEREDEGEIGKAEPCRNQPDHDGDRVNRVHALWLTAFFALGTVFSYEASLGASWGFCLTLSTIPTFLALIELQGKRRPWLVGTWATLATLARYELALIWPIYMVWLWRLRSADTAGRSLERVDTGGESRAFIISPLLAIVFYFSFNLARFGTLYDPSLWLWYAQDAAGGKLYPWGPFSVHYLPLGIFTALFAGPHFSIAWPWLRPTAFGQSLLLTSPALLLVLRTRAARLMVLAVLVAMVPSLTVWSNGVEQFGARYWIQALPFLLLLMARQPIDRFAKTLILASILFCCWGTYSIRAYGWG